ncbi:uncharacterized protein VDAG_08169 [Verticillium dahliae VdLs.17]|uniref:Zn(2)-C6 fungal-type domain-containing protein n=1 Tax=Verticillium dahliae (strain VdLs.17 / ATCC MYA-4575 / FGSC 10137) TaxID=498257 RepID=G2XDD7_VERDV|nr:uncharacterized protein VDAG_08169 [Verticillium dahliae VdLs.17]EGY17005.1 hypothetical protein VDAG_08169 [Verticillium dahliae VdLs.17]
MNHCDRILPSCGRCAASGRECVKGYKFKALRHAPFGRAQKWPRPGGRLRFVVERGDGVEDWDNTDHDMEDQGGKDTTMISAHQNGSSDAHEVWHRPSTTYPVASSHLALASQTAYQASSDQTPLDLCDPDAHFNTSIPARAGTCPILLNAIFALSARHLAHTLRYDALASNRYHEQCLTYLIPLLDHAVTVSDENLFAATIILRVLEEMDVPVLGQDTHGHLLGIHAFVAPHSAPPTPTTPDPGPRSPLSPHSLSAACFWVGLRQEIYSAVMNHQPVRMNLAHPAVVDRSTTPADDYAWANRAIVHCADVLNFCFGPDHADRPRWHALREANKNWKAALPASYMPVFYRERDLNAAETGDAEADAMKAFPEVWYWKGCHTELYLALFDPAHPRTGLQRRAADAALASQARTLVRSLCGIGTCNRWCPPAMFTACMGVAAAGDRFEDRRDQEALLALLRATEREHARPTRAVCDLLKGCWGWDENKR